MPVQRTSPTRVLVIDDEVAIVRALEMLLEAAGMNVVSCVSPELAMAAALDASISVVLVDLHMPVHDGMEILRAVKMRRPEVQVIIMTGWGTVSSATAAVKKGAWDFITKPFENSEEVLDSIKRAVAHFNVMRRNSELEELAASHASEDFIGTSEGMQEVFRLIGKVSQSQTTLLITGESGTGKELVARSLHHKSQRARKPFVAINCSAMTPTLLESELFGHLKGAFTGATSYKQGLFEAANGGTLFMDEIGDMPLPTQVALLRVLQESEVRPVGATGTMKVDVRVIAATNADLHKAMTQGRFRDDLFYRLNVISIAVPPLRRRREDIALLAYHFLARHARKLGKKVGHFKPDALQYLEAYNWPGNVRELENAVERAVVLSNASDITVENLPENITGSAARTAAVPMECITNDDALPFMPYAQAKKQALTAFDTQYLARALKETGGNITAAATLAGLDRSNFRRLIKQYKAMHPIHAEHQDGNTTH